MAVSQPSTSSSIVLSDLPHAAAEAVARVLALFDEHVGSGEGPDDFEAAEQDALATMKDVSCLVLRSVIESRDDGAPRIERDGQVWYRVPYPTERIPALLDDPEKLRELHRRQIERREARKAAQRQRGKGRYQVRSMRM